jgi:hypothetical protein
MNPSKFPPISDPTVAGQAARDQHYGVASSVPLSNQIGSRFQALPSIPPVVAPRDLVNLLQPWVQESSREKQRIADRLGTFNSKDNTAWTEITARFGLNIKQPELLNIATVLATKANIKLDRDAKRRKAVLLKWFQENWAILSPFLDFVVLEDS